MPRIKKVAPIASQGTLDRAYQTFIPGSAAAATDMEILRCRYTGCRMNVKKGACENCASSLHKYFAFYDR